MVLLVNLTFSELKPNSAWKLDLFSSQAEPAQLELFGSSQLKLKLAWYTLGYAPLITDLPLTSSTRKKNKKM